MINKQKDKFIVDCTNNSKEERQEVYKFLVENRNYSGDDVDIFKGDEITSVNLDTLKLHATTPINTGESLKYGNYKHFSTKEKAEEYVLMNKPCLSIKDILDNFHYSPLETKDNLIKLVKSKL